jgi:hypothetical protein
MVNHLLTGPSGPVILASIVIHTQKGKYEKGTYYRSVGVGYVSLLNNERS